MARLLRDAQVNTIWEGPDNILCLDVRRASSGRTPTCLPRPAARAAGRRRPATATPRSSRRRIDEVEAAIDGWRPLDRTSARPACSPWPSHGRRLRRRPAGRGGGLGVRRLGATGRPSSPACSPATPVRPRPAAWLDDPPRSSAFQGTGRRDLRGHPVTSPGAVGLHRSSPARPSTGPRHVVGSASSKTRSDRGHFARRR